MTRQQSRLLSILLKSKESTLIQNLPSVLRQYYKTVHSCTDYIYAEGELPVALVAHMDTIYKRSPENIYHDSEQHVLWSPEGLGADDRAGIFSILCIIEKGLRPSIIFTSGEELGGVGAMKFVEDFPSPRVKTNYLIELDRAGSAEAVYYECGSKDLRSFISSFGFQEAYGSFSDIAIMGPSWNRGSVNLSIGYENEHSNTEILHYDVTLSTIDKVKEILYNENNRVYHHEQISMSQLCDCCDYRSQEEVSFLKGRHNGLCVRSAEDSFIVNKNEAIQECKNDSGRY